MGKIEEKSVDVGQEHVKMRCCYGQVVPCIFKEHN
jgi:hypothetical protein